MRSIRRFRCPSFLTKLLEDWLVSKHSWDRRWYLLRNPDVARAGVNPLWHYLRHGEREGRDFSASFSPRIYRRQLETVGKKAGRLLLLHYILWGRRRGVPATAEAARLASTSVWAALSEGAHHRFRATPPSLSLESPVWALFLPQFHPIPENDEWWGTGFTEWRNVVRALPRFAGHEQPKNPRDFGYYDLSVPGTLSRLAAAARKGGVAGFCIYYYWFSGKRILETPTEALLADPSIDLPFFLLWANENWTRTWDGQEREVLLEQRYSPEDDPAMVADWARHFRDPRYLRWDRRPVLFLYRPNLIPDFKARVGRWRELLRRDHGLDPWIGMAQAFGQEDPREFGLDGAYEFPPHKFSPGLKPLDVRRYQFDPGFTGTYYAYADLVSSAGAVPKPSYDLVRGVTPGWDNEARRPGRGVGFVGATPDLYQEWLERSLDWASRHPVSGRNQMVLVNAWNEWAEGAYLEPDLRWGWAYLEATARAVRNHASGRLRNLIVVGHDAHRHGAQRLLLEVCRWFALNLGLEIDVVLMEGGDYLDDYRRSARVFVAPDPTELTGLPTWSPSVPVLTNTVVTGPWARALRQRGHRVVSLVHEMEGIIRQRSWEDRCHDLGWADVVVFPHPTVRDSVALVEPGLRERAQIRPQGLYHAVPFDADQRAAFRRRWGVEADTWVVCGVGFGDRRKGFDLFLEACRAASSRPWLFLWCGNLDDWARGLLEQAELSPSRFLWIPFQDDVAPVFCGSDLLALTSREDPYPSVVLEAKSSGLPVVAFEGTGGFAGRAALGDISAFVREIDQLLQENPPHERARHAEAEPGNHSWSGYCVDLFRFLRPTWQPVTAAVLSYNYAEYIEDRLHSVLHQTYPLAALVFLDDASTDASVDLAKGLLSATRPDADWDLRSENSGSPFAQWSRSVELCRTPWLWIAEADDTCDDTFLAEVLATVGDRTVLAFCDSKSLSTAGEVTAESYRPYLSDLGDEFEESFTMEGVEFVRRYLGVKNVILNVSACVWRTKALQQAVESLGGELFTWRLAGDWRLYAEALLVPGAEVSYVARPLNGHRRHRSGVTNTTAATQHLDEIQRMHAWMAERTSVDRTRQSEALEAARRALDTQGGPTRRPAPPTEVP